MSHRSQDHLIFLEPKGLTMAGGQFQSRPLSAETERELLSARIDALEKQMDQIQHERDKALIWGIRTLGSMLLALAAWAYSAGIFGKHPP